MKSFSEWESEAGHILIELTRVLEGCQRTSRIRCASALLSDSDQLLAVASHLEDWIPVHPCPYPDLDFQFVRLARSYATCGETFEILDRLTPRIDWSSIDSELFALFQAMAWTVTKIQYQSIRLR